MYSQSVSGMYSMWLEGWLRGFEHSTWVCMPRTGETSPTPASPMPSLRSTPPMPSLSAGECRVRICADAAGAPPVEEALRAALALIKGDGPMLRSPIYMHLLNGLAYDSGALRIAMAQPECFERLAIRVTQHDPAKGCIDPDVLAADDGRDFVW